MAKENNRKIYTVLDKKKETSNVTTLRLSCLTNGLPEYISGQYITVYFPEIGTPEGKAYSISSAPSEKTLNITVKSMGEFSNRLSNLKPYDSVNASLPYGYFYSESKKSHLVMMAAGIGIAPFRSMIKDLLEKNVSRNIFLFHSSRTENDIIFKKEFDDLSIAHKNFIPKYFVTRETHLSPDLIMGRMDARSIIGSLKTYENTEFMVCGSISFTRDIWKALKSAGIPEETIYTEAFFSH